MKIKKALCLVLATVMTASLASVPAMADTPTFGGVMPGVAGTEKSDAQKVLEMIPDMEYTAENVRVAVYTMGVSKDMTYAFNGMLNDDSLDFDVMPANQLMEVLEALGVNDMQGVADFIRNNTSSWQVNPISIFDPKDAGGDAASKTLNGTTLTINSGNNTSDNSYKVENANQGPNDYTKDTDLTNDIKITPNTGYKLKSVTVSGTAYRATASISGSPNIGTNYIKFTDLLSDIKSSEGGTPETDGVTIKQEDLKRTVESFKSTGTNGNRIYIATFTSSGDALSNEGVSGAITFTVTTEPVAKGDVNIEGTGKAIVTPGLFSFNGGNYNSTAALATAINSYIATNNTLKVGDTLAFDYDTKLIESVEFTSGNDLKGSSSDGHVTFSIPDTDASNNTITVKYKTMSGEVTVTATGEDTNPITYNFRGTQYNTASELSSAINEFIGTTTPVDTQLSFTYTSDAVSNITDDNSGTWNNNNKSFSFKTKDSRVTINITFKNKAGNITFAEADTNGLPKHITSVNVTSGSETRSFTSATELNRYLNTLYEGTSVNFTFFLESGYSISKYESTNELGVKVDNAVNQYALSSTGDTITITTASSDPKLTLTTYGIGASNDSTKGSVVLAEVTNANELDEATLNGANLTVSAECTHTDNPTIPTVAPVTANIGNQVISDSNSDESGIKNANYAGIVFAQKNEQFNYTYNFRVNADLSYNSGADNKTASTNITISKN